MFASNPVVYLFKAGWRYAGADQRKLVLVWAAFITSTLIHLFCQPLIWAELINTVQTEGINKGTINWLLILLCGSVLVEIVFWALHGPARFIEEMVAFKIRANYRKHLLSGVMTLPLEWHTDHHSGDTIDKIERGARGLHQFSENSFRVIYALVQLIGSYLMLAYFCPPAAFIVSAIIAIVVWITVRFDRIIVAQFTEINRKENAISESVFDAVSNISTVIILRVERLVFDAIMHKVLEPYGLVRKNVLANEWKWFLTNMCCTSMAVLVVGAYLWENYNNAGGLLMGSLYLLIQYLSRVSEQFYEFTNMYGELLQRRARVANAEELSRDFKSESFTNHILPAQWKSLLIEDLSFSYQNGGQNLHLDAVSLTLQKGERIAFVGETGSGKTTLLKVMRDLYHPLQLKLSVDGKPLPSGFADISRAIALVPQDPEIFATTILENITLGAHYEQIFVDRFCAMACFSDVVESLPQGFASSIKEKGVNLSGGQQQRLALARGLLACDGKDIVLLDEPTSSLDTITERRVYQNILDGFKGKTIISSVHRLHLLPLFDRVCMFESGKLIASGTLQHLLSTCPQFVSLWEAAKQASAES